MNITLLVCGILTLIIAILALVFALAMVKSAKEADEMMHEAFLKEVERIKEEHRDE